MFNKSIWSQQDTQTKKFDLIKIINGSFYPKYSNIEDHVAMAEFFIDLLSINQHVEKEVIVEELCKRCTFLMMEKQTDLTKEPAIPEAPRPDEKAVKGMNFPEGSTVPKPLQANGIKAMDKYKKKDEKTVNEVYKLLSKGKNYSEIGRELHIDRRTVKKIAVKYGFADE